MKRASLLFLVIILATVLYAIAPVVTNATAAQRTDGSKILDIYYDVACASNDSVMVYMSVSDDGGSTFNVAVTYANLSGDIGRIHTGTGKHIIWQAGNETQSYEGSQFAFKVQAWDIPTVPANFALIQSGTFNNGTSNVTVSFFYMSKYELTQAEYQAVMGVNPSYNGSHPTYPVERVSWYDAIEYCNRRSINEGLTPCYSYSTYGTNPVTWPAGWKTDPNSETSVSCSWTANGYRLPTEAEWEFAARGGNLTHNYTYSGGNTIETVAWYTSNSGNATHTVGTRAANELGIFDMSGNVWEWCWDIYGAYPIGEQTNPHGAISGSTKVRRSGGAIGPASECAVSCRLDGYTGSNAWDIGFRICRGSL